MVRSAAVAAVAVAAILLSAPVVASATCAGDAGWSAVTYSNGYSDAGGSWAAVGYRRDGLGFVHLEGAITGASNSSGAFTLPVGYRPEPTRVDYSLVSSMSPMDLSLQNGVAYFGGGGANLNSGNWAELDGITFYAGPSCESGWSGGGSGGMTNPMTTAQDLIVAGASGAPGRLAVGSSGQVLAVGSGGVVGWASAASTSFNLASFSGDALATINQGYSLVLVIGALLVLGVGYTIASGLRK